MIALRAAHFAVTVALAGGLVFVLYVARPSTLRERLPGLALWCLALVVGSGALWFIAQAAEMSGVPWSEVLAPRLLTAVLEETLFGRVSLMRLVIATALGATLLGLRRFDAWLLPLSTALAAALLGSLAATGHAAAEEGADRIVHLTADAVHLLAVGAWLGSLPLLALVLRKETADAAPIVRRFSVLGMVSVAALALSGVVNAAYTVGRLPALFGTDYGRLLCAKLALFAAMAALAAINRWRWTPRHDFVRLRRNALAEAALGLAALGVAAALGVMIPAADVQTVWPFSRTLDWSAVEAPRQALFAMLAALLAAFAGVAIAIRTRKVEWLAGGIAVAAGAGVAAIWLLAVPAYPTTYLQSPVSYGVASIARGAPLYAEHCTACHGAFGYGDGPSAAALPARPPYLTPRVGSRREGEMLWRLGHAGASAERLGDAQRWDVLNYLRALASADAARRLGTHVEPWRPVSAPDFTFQIGTGAQESLGQERGRRLVLLVLYSRPHSLARLRALAEARLRLDRLGVRVLAVPLRTADAVAPDAAGVDATMIATPDARLVPVYAMFTRTIVDDHTIAPRHLELLIDRQGYARARSMEPGAAQWSSMAELLRQAVALDREKPRVPTPRRHAPH